jgi:hypothetical protein
MALGTNVSIARLGGARDLVAVLLTGVALTVPLLSMLYHAYRAECMEIVAESKRYASLADIPYAGDRRAQALEAVRALGLPGLAEVLTMRAVLHALFGFAVAGVFVLMFA